MKTFSPSATVRLGLLLTLSLGWIVCAQPANAQGIPSLVDTNSAEWAAYQNDALFDQLSGAARTRAEMKFGPKLPRGPKENPTGSGQETSLRFQRFRPVCQWKVHWFFAVNQRRGFLGGQRVAAHQHQRRFR